jgi:hypothetical protein
VNALVHQGVGFRMSNNNRQPLTLPPRAAVPPPPPPAAVSQIPAQFAELIDRLPLPWVVGPLDPDDGYLIFVASDVRPITDDSRMNQFGASFLGWESTCPKPRHVVSLNNIDKGMAEFFVFAANRLAK